MGKLTPLTRGHLTTNILETLTFRSCLDLHRWPQWVSSLQSSLLSLVDLCHPTKEDDYGSLFNSLVACALTV